MSTPSSPHSRLHRSLLAIALACSLLFAGCAGDGESGTADVEAVDVPAIVRDVAPSVVMIITTQGLGSGVVWNKDGVVVTNAHVVGTETDVKVAFADGVRSDGKVMATDAVTDLAIVQTDRRNVAPASFATALPAQGALAIAIGSPLGFSNSVTSGIVSGIGRAIPGSAAQGQSLVDLLQTDAAISPGNSGGALVNSKGEVIGIIDAYIPPTAGAVAIGFAIPAYTVVDIVGQLLEDGTAEHAFLGVVPGTVTAELSARLNVSVDAGAVVYDVSDPGPAANAGIGPGDVIVKLGDQDIRSAEDLLTAMRGRRAGDVVDVEVANSSGRRTVSVTLVERPA